jgi:hypothetical protein
MAKILSWSMIKMITMIVNILNNKFDCVMVIEGNRGLGKSTLAIHLARGVAREFRKIGSDRYKFNWRRSLIYTKKETKSFFHRWDNIGIADEMINVTFNRDFYNEEQKDIIKMINMNRDHRNLFIACVPQFQTLDTQIKNLCKIRITVVRRGMCIIQTPNRTIYMRDKWDQATNEKIERDWIKKGIKNPHYTKLTTFRGVMKFPKLRDRAEEKYQSIKDDKRNTVAKEDMGIGDDQEKFDPYEEVIKMLKEGRVRNSVFLSGLAVAYGHKPESFTQTLRKKLRDNGINNQLASYYWEKKAEKKESGNL